MRYLHLRLTGGTLKGNNIVGVFILFADVKRVSIFQCTRFVAKVTRQPMSKNRSRVSLRAKVMPFSKQLPWEVVNRWGPRIKISQDFPRCSVDSSHAPICPKMGYSPTIPIGDHILIPNRAPPFRIEVGIPWNFVVAAKIGILGRN